MSPRSVTGWWRARIEATSRGHKEPGPFPHRAQQEGKNVTPANEAKAPLSNITVLDFGQVVQGPYASFLIAQAGANVIKIEPPNGEPLRDRAPTGVPITLQFAMLNANKRGITLNLKSTEGRELLFEM